MIKLEDHKITKLHNITFSILEEVILNILAEFSAEINS